MKSEFPQTKRNSLTEGTRSPHKEDGVLLRSHSIDADPLLESIETKGWEAQTQTVKDSLTEGAPKKDLRKKGKKTISEPLRIR